jgi:hypothetical protein
MQDPLLKEPPVTIKRSHGRFATELLSISDIGVAVILVHRNS